MPNDLGDSSSKHTENIQNIWRNIIILMVIGGASYIGIVSLLFFTSDSVITDLGYKHFASVFGLPAAAAAAILIVLVTRAVSGPMSVELFGLKFHGAASETLMWVLCFLAIAFAIERTWKLEYLPPESFSHSRSMP